MSKKNSSTKKFTLRITAPTGEFIEVATRDGDKLSQISHGFEYSGCRHENVELMVDLLHIAHGILASAIQENTERLEAAEEGTPQRVAADGTPTTRRFEPFTPEVIARFEEQASEGGATAMLMLDVAKLPESEQDDAQDKLLADGMLRMEYDKNGEEVGTLATKKAVDVLVCEGRLEYLKDPVKGYLCTRRPGGKFHRRVAVDGGDA